MAVADMEGTDNYCTGGTGPLIVEGSEGRTRIAMNGADGFHLYVPAGEKHFCVEPVSHAPNSFGRGTFRPQDIISPGEERQ